MTRDPLLAQIHIGRQQLALEEADYRAMLERVTGKSSAADLDETGRRSVIAELKRLGFSARAPQGRHRKASDKPYVRKIFALWGELKRQGIWRNADRASLIAFVKEMTDRDDPEWLSYREADKVIEALKAMQKRGRADA